MFNVDEFNAVLDSPCSFPEAAPTPSVNARSSRERSARPITRSDPEVTMIDHLQVATTITIATINMAEATTITVTTCDVISSSRRTAVMSATYLLQWR
jgi:hypothetical protein